MLVFFAGDPYGTRTHVTTVKGWCLNRLTNGPLWGAVSRWIYKTNYFVYMRGSGDEIRTYDLSGMNRSLYPTKLRRHLVAEEGFEPPSFGLWARRATWLLYSAIYICATLNCRLFFVSVKQLNYNTKNKQFCQLFLCFFLIIFLNLRKIFIFLLFYALLIANIFVLCYN